MRALMVIMGGALALVFRLLALGGIVAILGGFLLWDGYHRRAQEFDLREIQKIPQRSLVLDSKGRISAYIQGENRFILPLGKVPKDFINALMAREDIRFWEHDGVDYVGIGRAFLANVREGGVRQGGSTITQQLARNTFQLKARTIDRKLLEIQLSKRIEENFSKETILQSYINRIYFGAGAYGLERAAQVYFGKPAEALSLSESALLVGLIRSPNRYSPLTNKKGALFQRELVLDRMRFLGMISEETFRRASSEGLEVVGKRFLHSDEGYTLDAVRRELERILTPEQITLGGLRIYTTIDPDLQKVGEETVEAQMRSLEKQKRWPHPRKKGFQPVREGDKEKPTPYVQAALVAIENETGAVRVLVGGRDYRQSKFDRACLAKRQVGSTFKPFVYATAFQRGLLPGTWVDDSPILPGEYADLPKNWSPKNADGQYQGWLPAAVGLIRSRNTMSVRVGEFASLTSVLETAQRAGLGQAICPYGAAYLGGFEATLMELTAAYTIFPNGGVMKPPYLIEKIEDASGKVIYQIAARRASRALNFGAACLTSQILEEVLRSGTGSRAKRLGLTKAAAGKTGTSNDCKDAWFVGYTTALTCGVWVGLDRPKPIMKGGYGGVLALPVWVQFVQAAKVDEPTAPPPVAEGRRVTLCSSSNKLAHQGCIMGQCAYDSMLPKELIPTQRCGLHSAAPVQNDPYSRYLGPSMQGSAQEMEVRKAIPVIR